MENLKLIRTCNACPEQYDVLDGNGDYVGYIRFRYGELNVYPVKNSMPDLDVNLLSRSVNDDLLGVIPDGVRKEWLEESKKVILDYYDCNK